MYLTGRIIAVLPSSQLVPAAPVRFLHPVPLKQQLLEAVRIDHPPRRARKERTFNTGTHGNEGWL